MLEFSDNFVKGFDFLKKLLLMIHWPSLSRVPHLELPILFISGREDYLVQPEMMDKLFQAAEKTKYKVFFRVENGDHNDTWHKGGEDYMSEISNFMKEAVEMFK
jgi:fermentation-respiration switch protein FrsA (DUF1100 family)